jgi:hypothetical protein
MGRHLGGLTQTPPGTGVCPYEGPALIFRVTATCDLQPLQPDIGQKSYLENTSIRAPRNEATTCIAVAMTNPIR